MSLRGAYDADAGAPLFADSADDAVTADWRLTLRGAADMSEDGTDYEIVLVPEGSVTMHGVRGDTSFSGDAELVYVPNDQIRVEAGSLSGQGAYALDRDTAVSAALDISLASDDIDPDASPSVSDPALTLAGSVEGGLQRRFGRFGLEASAGLGRQWVSDSRYADDSVTDNAYRSWSGYSAGVRASYEITPILAPFGALSAERDAYDAASPSLGVFLDGWTYAARAGVSGAWRNGLAAELYGGYAWRLFDASSLAAEGAWGYGGSLTYETARGLTLEAELSSSVSDPGDVAGSTVRFGETLKVSARQAVTDWLAARASLEAEWASYAQSSERETDYSIGLGLDYLVNRHVTLSADYAYLFEDSTSDGVSRTHRVSAGLTFSR